MTFLPDAEALPYAARLELAIDGEVPRELAARVTTADVRQSLAAVARAEIAIVDPDRDSAGRLRLGASLRIGASGHAGPLFEGNIVSIEHDHDGANGLTIRLAAEDRLGVLTRRQTLRAFKDISAAGLAATFAGELGLASLAHEEAPQHALVVQHEQTDFDLLCDLAAASGLYPVLDGTTLMLVSLAGAGEAVRLRLGQNLASVRVAITSAAAVGRVETHALDLAHAATVTGGAALARQDREEMRDLGAAPTLALHLLNRIARTDSEAAGLAQATFDRAAATEGTAEGIAAGDPSLRPGRPIVVEGIAPALSSRYVLTRAVHSFSTDAGYVTEFSTTPPTRPDRPRTPSVTVGRVVDVLDPERAARCRVALPAYGDVETGWLQVTIAGAGPGRGLAALPETGDDVLVLCPDGDPAHGIVLGGLYGSRRLPRGLGTASPRAVVMRSAGGQALELSGRGGLARLSTSGGSLLELAPRTSRLAAASDLVIEAPGRTITIRADAINFERG